MCHQACFTPDVSTPTSSPTQVTTAPSPQHTGTTYLCQDFYTAIPQGYAFKAGTGFTSVCGSSFNECTAQCFMSVSSNGKNPTMKHCIDYFPAVPQGMAFKVIPSTGTTATAVMGMNSQCGSTLVECAAKCFMPVP